MEPERKKLSKQILAMGAKLESMLADELAWQMTLRRSGIRDAAYIVMVKQFNAGTWPDN